jgi:hypothetical protein
MKVILINSAGERTEHEFASLDEVMGQVGPKYPCIIDGRFGHVEWAGPETMTVRFVELDQVFQFFAYAHLPERLQAVSKRFYELAEWQVLTLPRNPERTKALNKLLESKDAAVRAALAR